MASEITWGSSNWTEDDIILVDITIVVLIREQLLVDNLLDSDDIHYMIGALKIIGINVEEDEAHKRAFMEGCGGRFPSGNESRD